MVNTFDTVVQYKPGQYTTHTLTTQSQETMSYFNYDTMTLRSAEQIQLPDYTREELLTIVREKV